MRRTTLCIAILLSVSACKYTVEDIEEWKGTKQGPGKIVALLLAEKYAVNLRIRAAMALIEMNREDVQPLRELQAAFRRLQPEDRPPILQGMVPQIEQALAAPPTDRGPSPQQIRAKDAAFLLLDFATGQERVRLEDALLRWVTADFNQRFLMGENSADKIVRQIGARAATALVPTLTPDQLAIEKIAELIAEVGDDAAKTAASAQLVQVAKAQVETPRGVREPTLVAMHTVGGRPMVGYVFDLVGRSPPEEAAAKRQFVQAQIYAMRAIKGHVTEADIEHLFAVATNENLTGELRDEGFERLGDLRSPAALPRLWPLLEDENDRVRWRVSALILSIGGAGVVREFLTKLPSGRRTTEYEERETGSYVDDIAGMNPPPLDAVRPLLVSESWIARYLAVRIVGQRGGRDDVARLQQLVGDRTRVPGRDPPVTIGEEARRAIERLQGG